MILSYYHSGQAIILCQCDQLIGGQSDVWARPPICHAWVMTAAPGEISDLNQRFLIEGYIWLITWRCGSTLQLCFQFFILRGSLFLFCCVVLYCMTMHADCWCSQGFEEFHPQKILCMGHWVRLSVSGLPFLFQISLMIVFQISAIVWPLVGGGGRGGNR